MSIEKRIVDMTEEENFSWLGRKDFIKELSSYIKNRNESTHICLEGVWGSGKTTTLQGLIKELSGEVLEGLEEELEDNIEKPLILYVNAWKYEHYEHPIFAIIKEMEEQQSGIIDLIKEKFKNKSYTLQASLNLPMFGFSLNRKGKTKSEILSSAEYIDKLNEFMTQAIEEYKAEKSNVLIIIIDELDRAKPDFVIRTLEVIHHLRDELPTHIVYSVDMNQLNSIIKHYYGYEYNTEIFTHKIFDVIFPLKVIEEPVVKEYIKKRFLDLSPNYNNSLLAEILINTMDDSQLNSLRTINKLIDNINSNLKKGYFISNRYELRFSDYYLGQENNLMAYIELLIVLEVISLNDPLVVRRGIKGEETTELCKLVLKKIAENKSEHVNELIKEAFNLECFS